MKKIVLLSIVTSISVPCLIHAGDDGPAYKRQRRQVPQEQTGCLEVIYGPMFASKSTTLMERLRRAREKKQRVAAFKHSFDTTRSGDTAITSHDDVKLPAQAVTNATQFLKLIPEGCQVVGIDEGQFFNKEQFPSIVQQLVARGLRVIVAGLNYNHLKEDFGPMGALATMAGDNVTRLAARCTVCDRSAPYTTCLATVDESGVLVGGAETYQPRCPQCFEISEGNKS